MTRYKSDGKASMWKKKESVHDIKLTSFSVKHGGAGFEPLRCNYRWMNLEVHIHVYRKIHQSCFDPKHPAKSTQDLRRERRQRKWKVLH